MSNDKATVVLISPPDERLIRFSRKYASIMDPPLGLAYLASYLRKHGHSVHILDSNSEGLNIEDICRRIEAIKPEIVGISVFTSMVKTSSRIADSVRKICPNAVIVAGGPHIHFMAEDFLATSPGFDYAVRGEGEETFRELIEFCLSHRDPASVKGITYRSKPDGKLVSTSSREFITNLDDLPLPAWDLLPMNMYRAPQVLKGVKPFTIIMTSRGCPFNCEFCNSTVAWGRRQRRRSPGNVIREISELHQKYGVKALRFGDDLFTLDKEWAGEICEGMIKNGLSKIKWEANARIGTLDEKLLNKMKRAGCLSIAFGIEFGNQSVLNSSNKGTNLTNLRPTVEMIRRAGLRSKGFFMIGYPSETRETIEDTIRLAKTCGVNYAVFSMVTPFPGTILFDTCEKNGLLRHKNWEDYQFGTQKNRPIRIPAVPEEELIRLFNKAVNGFHYSPTRILDYLVYHPKFMMTMVRQKLVSALSPQREEDF